MVFIMGSGDYKSDQFYILILSVLLWRFSIACHMMFMWNNLIVGFYSCLMMSEQDDIVLWLIV